MIIFIWQIISHNTSLNIAPVIVQLSLFSMLWVGILTSVMQGKLTNDPRPATASNLACYFCHDLYKHKCVARRIYYTFLSLRQDLWSQVQSHHNVYMYIQTTAKLRYCFDKSGRGSLLSRVNISHLCVACAPALKSSKVDLPQGLLLSSANSILVHQPQALLL